MYRSNRSFNITQAFDTFAVPRRREFDYQSLPGGGEIRFPSVRGGEFELPPRFLCEISSVANDHGGQGVRGFSWRQLCLCGQLVTRKGLKQALCHIRRYLNFNIFNIGFRL